MLDKLLDIKRLAESHDDAGYDPYTLLEMIADSVQEMIAASLTPIIIEVRGGVVVDVLNVPLGIAYEICDHDNQD